MTNSDNGQAPEQPPTPGPEIRPMEPNERIIRANGVNLCVQTFGDRADPPILLIMGGASSMDWWEDVFCEHLMAGSRFVIRYDHRDTGRSVSYEPGAAPYSLRDLAEDAVGLLDAFGLESVHLVGMSMGGWIGQLVALDHPDRVASLTLISTSPTAGSSDPDLPEMSQELQAFFAEEATEPDWSDRNAVIDSIVEGERQFAGSRPFDEAAIRDDCSTCLRSHDQPRLEHYQPCRYRLGRSLEGAPRGGERPDARHSRHRGPHVPLRQRGCAGEGDCWSPAARSGAGGPRGAPSGSVGRCRACHIATHGVCALSRPRRPPRYAIRSLGDPSFTQPLTAACNGIEPHCKHFSRSAFQHFSPCSC